ncbi:MAG: hypothetical protein HGA44_18820, partial [Cellulomonadaceae bacterium]|nr:hypothetical protein [Cellulomonadaceae bacterium]
MTEILVGKGVEAGVSLGRDAAERGWDRLAREARNDTLQGNLTTLISHALIRAGEFDHARSHFSASGDDPADRLAERSSEALVKQWKADPNEHPRGFWRRFRRIFRAPMPLSFEMVTTERFVEMVRAAVDKSLSTSVWRDTPPGERDAFLDRFAAHTREEIQGSRRPSNQVYETFIANL